MKRQGLNSKIAGLTKQKSLLFIIGFALVGIIALVLTKAATPFASIEPESGVKSGEANFVQDGSASNGSYVQFGTPPVAAATKFLSPTGNDSNPCTQTAPCRTLNRGYDVGSAGETVELAGGSYNDTNFGNGRTLSANIIFRPAAGSTVTFTNALVITTKFVELRDVKFSQSYEVTDGAESVTLRGITTPVFAVMSQRSAAPRNISIIGGSVGPHADGPSVIGSNDTTLSPTNIVVDGVLLHDFTRSATSVHTECLQVWAADGLTVRNSKFTKCAIFSLSIQHVDIQYAPTYPPTPTNILIENNFFDCQDNGGLNPCLFALSFASHGGTSWSNVTVRHNSSNQSFTAHQTVPYSNVKFIGNIAPGLAGDENNNVSMVTPRTGLTVSHNVWYGYFARAIGTGDIVAPSGFISEFGGDLHLTSGAAAINRVPADSSINRDIDGNPRPLGSASDAGADELQ